jgi:dUTP pyrophosphatase
MEVVRDISSTSSVLLSADSSKVPSTSTARENPQPSKRRKTEEVEGMKQKVNELKRTTLGILYSVNSKRLSMIQQELAILQKKKDDLEKELLEPLTVCFRKLHEQASTPTKATTGAAGWDLYATNSVTIIPFKTGLIKTNIQICLPPGTYGRLASRSGLAFKHCVDVMGGVIDPDYRGEIFVLLRNSGDQPFVVRIGDRIAQIILERFADKIVFCETKDEFPETERSAQGFGSSGV